jgi:hypothetical protein
MCKDSTTNPNYGPTDHIGWMMPKIVNSTSRNEARKQDRTKGRKIVKLGSKRYCFVAHISLYAHFAKKVHRHYSHGPKCKARVTRRKGLATLVHMANTFRFALQSVLVKFAHVIKVGTQHSSVNFHHVRQEPSEPHGDKEEAQGSVDITPWSKAGSNHGI